MIYQQCNILSTHNVAIRGYLLVLFLNICTYTTRVRPSYDNDAFICRSQRLDTFLHLTPFTNDTLNSYIFHKWDKSLPSIFLLNTFNKRTNSLFNSLSEFNWEPTNIMKWVKKRHYHGEWAGLIEVETVFSLGPCEPQHATPNHQEPTATKRDGKVQPTNRNLRRDRTTQDILVNCCFSSVRHQMDSARSRYHS